MIMQVEHKPTQNQPKTKMIILHVFAFFKAHGSKIFRLIIQKAAQRRPWERTY